VPRRGLGHFLEHRQPGLLALFQVVGVDALGLVGHGDAGAAGLQPGVMGLLEITGVEQAPGGEHGGVLRQRLGVAACSRAQCFFSRGGVMA
jgi:hypothetical protein